MSKALPELIGIGLLMNKRQFKAAEKCLLLLEIKRQKALQPVFAVVKEASRVQKNSVALGAVIKKFNSIHEYKRKQVADIIYDSITASTLCNTVDNEIHRHYALARYLQQRMITNSCLYHVEKAIKMAIEYDRWNLALELSLFKMHAVLKQPQIDIEQKLQQHYEKIENINMKITIFNRFTYIHNTLYVYYKKHYRVRNIKVLRKFELLANECALTDTSQMGLDIKLLQNTVLNQYNILKGEAATALSFELKIINLWQLHPHRISHTPWRYAIQINNLLQNLNAMEDYTRHPVLLRELKKLYSRTDNDKIIQQYELLYLELQWRMNTGNFTKAIQLVQQATDNWASFRIRLSQSKSIALAYNCAITCFVAENFRKARGWFTKIIEFSRSGLRQNTREAAIMLRTIVSYELGDDPVNNYKNNLDGKLKGYARFYKFEKDLNDTLLKLCKLNKSKSIEIISAEMKRLLYHLDQLQKHLPVKGIEGLEETKLWLQSRVTRRSMTEEMMANSLPANNN